ncbi:TPA_asm: hypothetical protein [ssRNA phage Gerhypos.4_13]|uniref:Uncharacterized protein n=2 Tax=Fiersviridae TaxID=2842319 RepID=A0A8S5KZN8_9VIRU|nr:hypothetical protein QIJ98_gp1 [ssRNA phage Gerhypos.4_13]QDH91502.1 MAG: hypothetical protein H4Bulk46380_000001 [Leviviridae sp.]DAD50541.1 TPA_asm: hypothetical protein [ssRNA phage Gerhypos.4_13]
MDLNDYLNGTTAIPDRVTILDTRHLEKVLGALLNSFALHSVRNGDLTFTVDVAMSKLYYTRTNRPLISLTRDQLNRIAHEELNACYYPDNPATWHCDSETSDLYAKYLQFGGAPL